MRRCALCGRNGRGDALEEHHIFNGPFRKKADQYGMTVYLCGIRCHREGPAAAHRCKETMDRLKRYGQRKAMRENGWTVEEFIAVFGKNYL